MKELVFTPHGTVLLRNGENQLWASDGDVEFSEEFPDEFLNMDDDADDIIDYLIEADFIKDDEEINIVEQSLDDVVSDDAEGDDDD